jgi:hypothetical protein
MADRGDEFRSAAAQCLALAQGTTDTSTRTALVALAQRFYDRANRQPTALDPIPQDLDDQPMAPPVAPEMAPPLGPQQRPTQPKKQQPTQPKKEER